MKKILILTSLFISTIIISAQTRVEDVETFTLKNG